MRVKSIEKSSSFAPLAGELCCFSKRDDDVDEMGKITTICFLVVVRY